MKHQQVLLKAYLDKLISQRDLISTRAADPVRFPWRFSDPCDRCLISLFAALLAYGRANAIGNALEGLIPLFGSRPAESATAEAATADPLSKAQERFQGVRYRFTSGEDLARLWVGVGALRRRHGSLRQAAIELDQRGGLEGDLVPFYSRLRAALIGPTSSLPASRGFSHLLPNPDLGSALKRPALFLRWMVRGPDMIDFGLWRHLGPHRLWIPLDTHVQRLSRYLGLSERPRADLQAAREVSAALRALDQQDPLRFDLALAHLGISGDCQHRYVPEVCRHCPLSATCQLALRGANQDH